jgi:hypothetical protein
MPCNAAQNLERYVRRSSHYGSQTSLLCRGYALKVSRDVIYSLPHLRPDVSDEIIECSAMQGGLPGWRGAIRL